MWFFISFFFPDMDRFLMEPCGFRLLGWLRWCNGRHSLFLSLFSYSFFILLHSSHHFSLAILARFFIYILNKIPIFSSSSMAYLHTHTLFLTSLITHSHVKHSAQKKKFFWDQKLIPPPFHRAPVYHLPPPTYTGIPDKTDEKIWSKNWNDDESHALNGSSNNGDEMLAEAEQVLMTPVEFGMVHKVEEI